MFKKIESFLATLRPKIQAVHDITGAILKYLPESVEPEMSDLEQIANEISDNTNEGNI
jgi:hypothetical protein